MKKIIWSIVWLFLALGFNFACNSVYWQEGKQSDWGDSSEGVKRECLMWMWKWCFSYDKLLWWDDSKVTAKNENKTVGTIAQDVILAATYMVWTVLTIVIIYCGLMYIFAARDGKDVSKYKNWLVNAWLWAVLVRWAYAIVRLIQYIAKW